MGFKILSLSVIVLVGQCIWNIAADGNSSYCYKKSDCGPSTWSGSCQTGSNQSPIDIPYNPQMMRYARMTDLYQSSCYFRRQNFTLKNSNGHTAQVDLSPDQTSRCFLTGNLLNGNKYVLANMHFHWGTDNSAGSEHTINKQRYVMEGHLVHYRSNFNSVTQAMESGERDALTVIGVNFAFYDNGTRDYPGLTPITDALKNVRSSNAKTQASGLQLSSFLFQSPERNVPVMQYDGSLTTPGCGEIVLWNVILPPCPISRAQLKEFTELLDGDSNPLVDNYRPTQELNGRPIRYYRSSIWY